MAFLEMSYFSSALGMSVAVNVILPEKAKGGELEYKTLYLLHGLSDDHTAWTRYTAIERYAAEYGIAVVMPAVQRSWYTDTADGANYFTFVSEELPSVCRGFFRGMSAKREDNYIAGLSMGGYGAVKAAFTHPEAFGGCAALSGALDIADLARRFDFNEWRGIFDFNMKSSEQLNGGKHDAFEVVRRSAAIDAPSPRVYTWCGESDHLMDCNNDFDELLTKMGIEHLYEHSEGDHTWKWWDKHIQDALKFLFGN